ncbi:deoxyuridine 5'-triphosphate nucleotidohydrolase [Auricularia subglabra TFB-10046 SS5]|nr:deoxyuridine 5'-triphosphate nucleotidohydrolase [Auricularia subglabra TFB-10046 SS5]
MIIPGAHLITRNLVRGTLSSSQQCQPCGVDLSLRRVLRWTSAGAVDFDNTRRQAAHTAEVPFDEETQGIALRPGAYLVEFNETVSIPLDGMGQLFGRSSLWRSGVTLTSGLVDAGYEGAMGGLLDVRNPHGVTLFRNAKLGQIVIHTLTEPVAGYSGVYQSSAAIGRQAATAGDE